MISARHARRIREVIEDRATTLTDETAVSVPEFFPRWSASGHYAVDDRVRYDSDLWKCLTEHDAQEAWTPTDAPSLWAKVLIDPSGKPLPWVQPDSTNPYMKGDRVTHNGSTWVSTVDNNVWEPGVYGWDEE